MKATASSKQCFSSPDSPVRAGKPGLPRGLHHPRRHSVPMRAAPRLTDGQRTPEADALPVPASRTGNPIVHSGAPRVLLVDGDASTALALSALLTPEASVLYIDTLEGARELLRTELFALVVLDPGLPDGDGSALLPALATTPLLVYAEQQPHWPGQPGVYLAKPFTPPRVLFSTISRLLGIAPVATAGD